MAAIALDSKFNNHRAKRKLRQVTQHSVEQILQGEANKTDICRSREKDRHMFASHVPAPQRTQLLVR